MIIKFIAVATILAACCFCYDLRRYERLPKSTKPLSYNLNFRTQVHAGGVDISGLAKIKIVVIENTDRIILHGVDFEIENLNLLDLEKDVKINNLKHVFDAKAEQLVIMSASTDLKLISGKQYLLTVSYQARPCSRPNGFCIYWYGSESDKRIPLGATQLSQGSARLVFPCYDEPALKANFTISVTHGKDYMALSNMPQQGDPIIENDGYVTTNFLETPPMSTHLVAFTVSNYENITEKVGNTDVRLFFKPNSDGGRSALQISKKALSLMNDYFNISFPLPKIDHFSVPGMDQAGAENWGLILYSESVLLNDLRTPDLNPENLKAVSIEMAHMWFGGLVTPAWWSQNWLSEGISAFYGIKFINLINPEWKLTIDNTYLWYLTEVCSLSCNTKSEWDYDSVFGKMSSVKGAYLMTMFEKLLKEEVFRMGIVKYLEKYQYSSSTDDDLFDCLGDSMEGSSNPYFKEKTSLKKAMKSWATQKYHPAVIVARDYKSGTFTLKQVPYKTMDEGDGKELWWIPITFATSTCLDFDNVTADFIFPGVKEVEINPTELGKPLASNDWLILNKQQLELYRVTYDDKNWNLITCALLKDPNMIPEITKQKMIKDLFELFVEGYVEAPVLFNFMTYLKKETTKLPWQAAMNAIVFIFNNLKTYEGQGKEYLKQFIGNIISNASETYNANENSENFKLTDENRFLFELSCRLQLEKCDRIMDIIYNKAKTPTGKERITIWENSLFFYGSCRIYNHAKKDMKDFIDNLADSQNYGEFQSNFVCTKTKDQLKEILKKEIKGVNNMLFKIQISSQAMGDPVVAEAFVELLQEGDPELIRLFLHNAKTAITNAKTREHKDLLVKTWKRMGYSLNEGHYYGIDKKFARHDKIRNRMVQWLESDPIIPKLSCH